MALTGEPFPYRLDDNLRRGFKQAVDNNQTNLALHYLVNILDEMDKEDDDDEMQVTEVAEATPEPQPVVEEKPKSKPKTSKKTKTE